MAKKPSDKLMLAEHVLEVRHAAVGSFLDVRGYVADYIKDEGILPHWKIETNVVNFFDVPKGIDKIGAFAGFKSAGFMVYNPETRNLFADKAGSFWRSLIKNKHYKIPQATRFGARTKVFLPSEKSFEEINNLVFRTFYSDKTKELLGGSEKDVQFVFDLEETEFNVRLSGGPVAENEVDRYLNFESEEFNKCGLFLDLDYFVSKDLKNEDIPKLVKKSVDLTWKKIERIASSLGL